MRSDHIAAVTAIWASLNTTDNQYGGLLVLKWLYWIYFKSLVFFIKLRF